MGQKRSTTRAVGIRRLKDLESENGKLKKLLAETMLDNAGLKGLLAKNF